MLDGTDGGGRCLCPWRWECIVDEGQEPNGAGHWWATWRWQRTYLELMMRRIFRGRHADVQDMISDFLLGPPPEP